VVRAFTLKQYGHVIPGMPTEVPAQVASGIDDRRADVRQAFDKHPETTEARGPLGTFSCRLDMENIQPARVPCRCMQTTGLV
jgi:hypothetical protein